MPLVLRIFKFVSKLLIDSFLSLDLSLQLSELSTEIINSIERRQERLVIIRVPYY